MTVRVDTSSDPVVFATGGPVTGLKPVSTARR